MKIVMTEKRYELSGSKFVEVKTESKEIDQEYLDRLVDSGSLFRSLGGSETLKRNYTCRGYMPVKLTSKSPDRTTKVVREFIYE